MWFCLLCYHMPMLIFMFFKLLLPSLIWLCSSPVLRDHGEGQVLAVLTLDRGDKSLSTPEDSLLVGKLGTSLSRPCHTLPCRSSLIGLALWRMQPTSVTARGVSNVSVRGEERRAEERRIKKITKREMWKLRVIY